jgi:hypothetical protein
MSKKIGIVTSLPALCHTLSDFVTLCQISHGLCHGCPSLCRVSVTSCPVSAISVIFPILCSSSTLVTSDDCPSLSAFTPNVNILQKRQKVKHNSQNVVALNFDLCGFHSRKALISFACQLPLSSTVTTVSHLASVLTMAPRPAFHLSAKPITGNPGSNLTISNDLLAVFLFEGPVIVIWYTTGIPGKVMWAFI